MVTKLVTIGTKPYYVCTNATSFAYHGKFLHLETEHAHTHWWPNTPKWMTRTKNNNNFRVLIWRVLFTLLINRYNTHHVVYFYLTLREDSFLISNTNNFFNDRMRCIMYSMFDTHNDVSNETKYWLQGYWMK